MPLYLVPTDPSTLETALTNFGSVITSVMGIIEANPIMLTCLIVPLVGAGVGMIRRLV